jgi:iron(III) transport system substrate-binding protein
MNHFKSTIATLLLIAAALSIIIPIPADKHENLLTQAEAQGTTLTIYSGRDQELAEPIIQQFQEDTGIEVEVIYAGSTALALQILEEGENSPADVFYSQDAGALGLLAAEGILDPLPAYILDSVEERFRSADGVWVGITGRARVITYNTDLVNPEELPDSIYDLTAPEWAGRVGWAPTNSSLHAQLTAMRVLDGDEAMQAFVEGMIANGAPEYESNSAAVAAVKSGEIDMALVNHYYMFREGNEDPNAPLANYYFSGQDTGNLVNVSGAGILTTSDVKPLAQQFIAYLLSRSAQTYFVEETVEYPLLIGMEADPRLLPLSEIQSPEIDLSNLADLEGTLRLLDEIRNQ